jgi:hypothetical protein
MRSYQMPLSAATCALIDAQSRSRLVELRVTVGRNIQSTRATFASG